MARGVVRAEVRRLSGRVPNPNWRRAINEARGEMQTLVHNDAIRRAGDAFRTGEYMASISSTSYGYLGFTLQSDVPQAWYLEYGTGLYGPKHRAYEINPREARALANWSEYIRARAIRDATGVWPEGMRKTPHSYLKWYSGGEPVYARQVIAPGMPAEPNLGPAIFENIDPMSGFIIHQIEEAWERG